MMEFWLLEILYVVLLIVQIRKDAEYRRITEKTIRVLQYCVDEQIRQRNQLIDLLIERFPNLKSQLEAERFNQEKKK